jgi:DNA-binding MarR family transcriptional regulator
MILQCNNEVMKPDSTDIDNNTLRTKPRSGAAFLLAQVGAHAASKFGERLAELKLVPAHAGILRTLAATPAITQQALASALGTLPSRLVALLDELESKGLVERRPHGSDRRSYALHLTEAGRSTLQAIGRVAREHQQALLAGLLDEEQRQLAALLQRIAEHQGLLPQVHPGYGRLERNAKL